MNGTGSTLPPPAGGNVREFAVRLTGDRDRLRLDFNKQAQEVLRLYFGLELIASLTSDGDVLLRRADAVRCGDPEMSGKIAALRAAQRAHGQREVANWNLLLKSKRCLEMGTAEPVVTVPTVIAADFAWWQREKMLHERKLIPKRIAAEVLGVGTTAESADTGRARPRRLKVKG